MNNRENILEIVGLPKEFSHVLLVLSLVLALAPFFSGHDFGILKIPNFSDNAKKILKIAGPICLVIVIGLHIRFFERERPNLGQTVQEPFLQSTQPSPKNKPTIFDIDTKILASRHRHDCLHVGIILDRKKDEVLIRFDFGEETWVDKNSVYGRRTPSLSDLSPNTHVYVALESGSVWAPGQVKVSRNDKQLIGLDVNAACRGDKVYEWAMLENIILRNMYQY